MRSLLFALFDRLFVPAPQRARVAFLKGGAFAHRGLHGPDVLENSRAAFSAAIAGGFGIELDVHASRDGDVFVFHDDELDRLSEGKGYFGATGSAALDALRLKGTSETIPRLDEILRLIAGKVPLLVEVKTGRRSVAALCKGVLRALEGYQGPVAVMSFDARVGAWFAAHAPHIVRGLVVTEEGPTALPDKARAAVVRHIDLWRARPDFLAYDVQDLPSRFASAQRNRGLPLLSWTVRTPDERAKVAAHADAAIFEDLT